MPRPQPTPTRTHSSAAPERKKIARLTPALLEWFQKSARDLPWRQTLDPYAIWISEIMLQQTQVKTVIPYWKRWLQELPDIASLAAAPPAKVLKLWEGLGYYTRARNLQKAAQRVVAERAGLFPNQFEDILALPGIGRYTAGAITSIAFNQPAPILDGNVIRVLARLFAMEGNPKERATNDALWALAQQLVESAGRAGAGWPSPPHLQLSGPCSALNQALMELGATLCTPTQPQCERCPVRRACRARLEDRIVSLPNLGARATSTARRFLAFAMEHDGRWLVQQRPAGGVNAHLWEFPNLEVAPAQSSVEAFQALFGMAAPELQPTGTIRHSITRYRMTVEVFVARKRVRLESGVWRSRSELDALAFSAAHRRILRWIQEGKVAFA